MQAKSLLSISPPQNTVNFDQSLIKTRFNSTILFCLLSIACHFYVKVYDAIFDIHFDHMVRFLYMTYLCAPWPNNENKVLSASLFPISYEHYCSRTFHSSKFCNDFCISHRTCSPCCYDLAFVQKNVSWLFHASAECVGSLFSITPVTPCTVSYAIVWNWDS